MKFHIPVKIKDPQKPFLCLCGYYQTHKHHPEPAMVGEGIKPEWICKKCLRIQKEMEDMARTTNPLMAQLFYDRLKYIKIFKISD